MGKESRSPIRDKPLRNPGQSIDDQLDDMLYDKLFAPFTLALFFSIVAGLEWWRYYHPRPPAPKTYTVLALVVVLYCLWRIWRFLPQVRQLKMAREGERAVGQYLERLREQGYSVFHDVLGERFNVDHVLIGPAGIFTVETKTRSKSIGANERVVFDGEKILVNGFEPDRNPIIQANAQASWLKALLTESTGRSFDVKPVIVFPGWFVEQRPGAKRSIWVLEPKALPSFLANEREILAVEDIKMASFHLSRFIRTRQ